MNQEEKWLLEEKYGGMESEAFHADCERLSNGEPLGYVIGYVPFLDCCIYLSSAEEQIPPIAYSQAHKDDPPTGTGIKAKQFALIPRVETEFWVEKAINIIQKNISPRAALGLRDRPIKILDLCAGSGAIGVAVAKAIPEAFIDFGEIDERLFPTIAKNLETNVPNFRSKLAQYTVLHSNLFNNIADKYDFILSNPPYIDPELDRTEDSVKKFEPHLALYGGAAGLNIIKQIIDKAPNYLNEEGQLWIEHEPEQSEEIQLLGKKAGFITTIHQDQYGIERYSILKLQ